MTSRMPTGQRIRIALGSLMLAIAWIGGLLSIVLWTAYAMYCVEWLHAPVRQVLMVTAAMMALSLGAFVLLGRLAAGMRRLEPDPVSDKTAVTGAPPP